ncbi:hypothetical protein BJX65DRAFT_306224 [Aspergillus insuetus]
MEELALFTVPRAQSSEDAAVDFHASPSSDHNTSSKPARNNLHPEGIESDFSESGTASDVEGMKHGDSFDKEQLKKFINRFKLKRKSRILDPKSERPEDRQYDDDDDTELLDISRSLAEAKQKSNPAQMKGKREGPPRRSSSDQPGENKELKKKPDSDGSEANFTEGGFPDTRPSAGGSGISDPEFEPSDSGRMDYRSLFAEGPRDEMRR